MIGMNKQGRKMKKARDVIQDVIQNESEITFKEGSEKKRRSKKIRKRILLGLLCILLAAGATLGLDMWSSRYPDVINMGTACDMGNMQQMDMSNLCQRGNKPSTGIPVTSLQAPQTAVHVDEFTLTAQYAHLPFMSKDQPDAWTYN